MQRPFNERINSHWVRGCFGEDWQESFKARDLAKDQALIGVWGHPVVQTQPLCSEWDVANASRLRREPVGRIIDDEENWVWTTQKPRKFKTPYYTNLNWDKIRGALRKYSTLTLERAIEKYSTPGPHPGPKDRPQKPKQQRRKKRLHPVTSWKKKIDPYAPLADHLEEYLQGQVKERKLPEPEVIASTKDLIEQRFGEFKKQAKSMIEINDAEVWRLKMYEALEALLKSGRVHEFVN